MTDITRIEIIRLQDGLWYLSFYARMERVYEEFFNELDTALALAPTVYRERFRDETAPDDSYYGRNEC